MAASVHGVRDRVDTILSHLDHTDEEARAAAVAVAEQFRLHGGPEEPHDQDALAEVIGDTPEEGPAPVVRVIEVEGAAETAEAAVAEATEAGGIEADEQVGEAPAPSVDELFARIRAGSDDPVPGGGEGAGGAASAQATPEAATQVMGAVVVEAAEDAPPPGPDDGLIAQRNELLGPVTAQLSRT